MKYLELITELSMSSDEEIYLVAENISDAHVSHMAVEFLGLLKADHDVTGKDYHQMIGIAESYLQYRYDLTTPQVLWILFAIRQYSHNIDLFKDYANA
jgi:hypothetical protein